MCFAGPPGHTVKVWALLKKLVPVQLRKFDVVILRAYNTCDSAARGSSVAPHIHLLPVNVRSEIKLHKDLSSGESALNLHDTDWSPYGLRDMARSFAFDHSSYEKTAHAKATAHKDTLKW